MVIAFGKKGTIPQSTNISTFGLNSFPCSWANFRLQSSSFPISSHKRKRKKIVNCAALLGKEGTKNGTMSDELPQIMRMVPTNVERYATLRAHEFLTSEHSNVESGVQGFINPQFRLKAVCKLDCKHCRTFICHRGMKAILLGDSNVQLYSTDVPPKRAQLVGTDYSTKTCRCRIVDVGCLGCGNIIGYHVSQPCQKCLSSCNNGHFWMFFSEEIHVEERKDNSGKGQLVWAHISGIGNEEQDLGFGGEQIICR